MKKLFLLPILFLFLFLFLVQGFHLKAKAGKGDSLRVLTTTTTLKSLVQKIGGSKIQVDSLTRGTQDPHFVEAKPSYMVKARRVHLVISVGLDLEVGWLRKVLRGSKNPKILQDREGHLETGKLIQPLEILGQRVDRSQGDIHPWGNPHFLLDPLRGIQVVEGIAKKLSDIDPSHGTLYIEKGKKLKAQLTRKNREWQERIQRTAIKGILTYHATLSYFARRFGLKVQGHIEPKPGVPPTAKHLLSLIRSVKEKKVSCILIGSFFETNAARRIQKSVFIPLETVPTEVGATSGAPDYEQLIESIVRSLESCHRQNRERDKGKSRGRDRGRSKEKKMNNES